MESLAGEFFVTGRRQLVTAAEHTGISGSAHLLAMSGAGERNPDQDLCIHPRDEAGEGLYLHSSERSVPRIEGDRVEGESRFWTARDGETKAEVWPAISIHVDLLIDAVRQRTGRREGDLHEGLRPLQQVGVDGLRDRDVIAAAADGLGDGAAQVCWVYLDAAARHRV